MSAGIGLEPFRAGIEDFLPLLIFIFIWWVSSRRARKNRLLRGNQDTAENSGPGRAPKANKGENQIDPFEVLQQMIFGGIEMPPMSPPQSPQPEAPLAADGDYAHQGVAVWEDEKPLPQSALLKGAPLEPLGEKTKKSPVLKASSEVASHSKEGRACLVLAKTSRRELQRAVIWSEVLAPPVALRDVSR